MSNSILTSAERLRVMINSIIDLAASDVGALSLDAEEVHTEDLIETTIQTLSGFAQGPPYYAVDHEVTEEASASSPIRCGCGRRFTTCSQTPCGSRRKKAASWSVRRNGG